MVINNSWIHIAWLIAFQTTSFVAPKHRIFQTGEANRVGVQLREVIVLSQQLDCFLRKRNYHNCFFHESSWRDLSWTNWSVYQMQTTTAICSCTEYSLCCVYNTFSYSCSLWSCSLLFLFLCSISLLMSSSSFRGRFSAPVSFPSVSSVSSSCSPIRSRRVCVMDWGGMYFHVWELKIERQCICPNLYR